MIGDLKRVGFVYKDISTVISKLEDIFDLSNIKFEEVTFNKNLDNKDIEPIKFKIGCATFTTAAFEFMEVLEGKNIFQGFLETSDGGLHHIGFIVKDIKESIKKMDAQGLEMIFNGMNSKLKLAIFDTRKVFGHDTKFVEEI